jgi:peptidoglycan biosynthesis protein MviN/MurJ (putative lipid II flippase)
MGEIKSLRITDPELERWVEEHIPRGDLNPIMNNLLLRYRMEQEQEYIENEKIEIIDRRITVFQGIMFLSIAVWMLVFALSRFYNALEMIATFMLILSGVLLCVYVIISYMKNKDVVKVAE